MPMRLLLIDNYDSFTYNLYQMMQGQMHQTGHEGGTINVIRNRDWTIEEIRAFKPDGVILSPGPGHPAKPEDFGVCREIITHQQALDCPILGVCLGMQGIVENFGGSIIEAPKIMHGKISRIHIMKNSPLFEGLDNPMSVMRYHSLIASFPDFPDELSITAWAETSPPEQRLIMALQHNTRPIYGVQFHPESVGTPQGSRLLANFLALCARHRPTPENPEKSRTTAVPLS